MLDSHDDLQPGLDNTANANDDNSKALKPDGEGTGEPLPELSPFESPEAFDHGEEFEPAVPRSIPKYLRQGSYAKRKKGVIYSLIALGGMFVVFAPIPFVRGLSLYILPLKWLHWIGFGLIAIGVWKFFANLISAGQYAYVKNGEPFVGRVLDCQKVDTGTADVPAFRHYARIEYHHPESGEYLITDFPEPDNWSTSLLEKMSCTLSRGDYVTLVRLPEQGDASTVVYGFLGLDPDREFILKNGRPQQGTSPFNAIMIAFLFAFIVLMVMALFDVLMFSFPISGDWKLPTGLAVGGFLCGGILGILSWKNSKAESKSEGPVASFIGLGFLGAIASPLALILLNSRLDHAETRVEPIEIVEFWNTTHNFVVRDYELEYKKMNDPETTKQHMRFSQISKLYGSKYGVEEISPGKFGYAWIKGIHPIVWLTEEEAEFDQPLYEVQFASANPDADQTEADVLRMVPMVLLENGKQVPVPEVLIDLDARQIEAQPNVVSIKLLSGR